MTMTGKTHEHRLSTYMRLKSAADTIAAAAMSAAAVALPRHRHALRTNAGYLRSGRRTMIGAPIPGDGQVGPHRPGIIHEATICEWMNMEYSREELIASYIHKAGPRKDLAILLRYLWAATIARDRQSSPAGPTINLLGVTINNTTVGFADRMLRGVIETCNALRMARELGDNVFIPRAMTVTFVNANNLNVYTENKPYARALLDSDFILPDGIGVKLAARMTGQALSQNLNGTDLFPVLMRSLESINGSIFLLGAEDTVLQRAAESIRRRFPLVRIAGTRNGYFGPDDEADIARQINESGADVVIVGMGTPRQELWMARNAARLRVSAVFCMGGLIDFLGGKNARAPMWMRQAGLEWVFRIVQEPRRMWKRYVVGNPVFLWRVWSYTRRRSIHRNRSRQA